MLHIDNNDNNPQKTVTNSACGSDNRKEVCWKKKKKGNGRRLKEKKEMEEG